ncbi:hypothetical protein [Rhodoflexus sp.]
MRERVAIKKPVVWILLGFWTLIMLNSVMYRHSHRLPDGKIVSHAHPYKRSTDEAPAKPHEHTDKELALLQLIDGQVFEPPVSPVLNLLIPYTAQAAETFVYVCSLLSACSIYYAGRAPPQV